MPYLIGQNLHFPGTSKGLAATQYSFIQSYATSDCARALLWHYDDAVGVSNCKEEN